VRNNITESPQQHTTASSYTTTKPTNINFSIDLYHKLVITRTTNTTNRTICI